MKDKMKKLSGLVSNAGKAAKGFADNAIQMADQNNDGKIDMSINRDRYQCGQISVNLVLKRKED